MTDRFTTTGTFVGVSGEVWASFGKGRRLLGRLRDCARRCQVSLEIVSVDRGWITTRVAFEADGSPDALRTFSDALVRLELTT